MDDGPRATARRLEQTVRHLAETIGPRPPGSKGEAAAAAYIAGRARELGLPARVVEFASAAHTAATASLRHESSRTGFPCLPSQFSVPGEARGTLAFVGDETGPGPGVPIPKGSIALVFANGSHAERMARLAEMRRRGAVGFVVAGPHLEAIETKLLRYPEVPVPVAAVSYRTGVALRRREGEAFLLAVEADGTGAGVSRNVTATLPGTGPAWLAVGAHLDTAPFCPGAGDNASGVAVVLELARLLCAAKRPAGIEFLWTGSEEYGALDGVGRGALAFFRGAVDSLERCIAYVDADDLGNPLGVPQLSLQRSPALPPGGARRRSSRLLPGRRPLRGRGRPRRGRAARRPLRVGHGPLVGHAPAAAHPRRHGRPARLRPDGPPRRRARRGGRAPGPHRTGVSRGPRRRHRASAPGA